MWAPGCQLGSRVPVRDRSSSTTLLSAPARRCVTVRMIPDSADASDMSKLSGVSGAVRPDGSAHTRSVVLLTVDI
jgi:hypothetical protein